MSYSFFTISGVLPLGTPRVYVPRAARPHLAWCAAQPSQMLGSRCRLKGDGTAALEWSSGTECTEAESDKAAATSSPPELGLAALLTTDAASGTRLTLYSDPAAPQLPLHSAAIPSRRRVVALWAPPTSTSADAAGGSEACAMKPLFASDDVGGIFAYQWGGSDSLSEPAEKRCRIDVKTESLPSEDKDGVWTPLAPAHSTLISDVTRAESCTSTLSSLFAVSRGTPGWAGLTALQASPTCRAALQLVSVREFFHDVRLIDPTRQAVVRTYSTTHAPTGVLCPSVQAAPHCVLVVEGCLATLYDMRCPSAVVSLGEVYQAQAEWRAAKDGAAVETEERGSRDNERGEQANGKGPTRGIAAASPAPAPPLIPGRLTSTAGQVRDICGTANSFEVACAVDRALCVYDLRKFNRLFTSSNVLKYVIGGVTSVAGGRGVVCTGIDAEVRLISLHDKADATAVEELSLAARVATQAQRKKQQQQRNSTHVSAVQLSKTGREANGGAVGPGGTFRTRLSTSVSCTTVWQGGWVTVCNGGGAAAVGLSVDGEVFLAQ
ncbi:hypothetical protein LSCM1_00797 [Leishmania martiniquensis]|uniref:Uncharacterized protein n=1 Tax=Leishmania martiniquensis TaxID=1580590 RepID=A0A836FPH2_9TRYP|nr:hypothetical protein LSCM1_00797 [Leishmania martiniquensis]